VFSREYCITLLKEKYCLLKAQGLERYPQRSDFSEREVMAIKAFLGPWPRALEAASVKPPSKNHITPSSAQDASAVSKLLSKKESSK